MSFNNDRRNYDTVVVGGGLAGLTAAIYLARGGSRVTLFEKAPEVGGRAQTRRQDGFLFNLGPHALYQGAEAQEVLDELGVSYAGAGPPIWKALTVHNNTLYRVPAGPRTFLSNDLLGVRERLELMAALLNVMRASPAAAAAQSAQEWMHRRGASQRVREFMFMVGRTSTYSSTMREMSAEVFLLQLQLTLRHGVLYLDGGWQTLVDGLRRRALRAGVQIETGCRVEEVVRGETGPELVLADGRSAPAAAVVLAVEPKTARGLLPQDDGLASAVARMRPVMAATLDVALRRLPRPERPVVLGLRQPLYLSVYSAVAEVAPPGSALLHLAKYLQTDDEAEGAEQELEALMDLAQPGWRRELVHRRFVPHFNVVHHLAKPPDGLRGRAAGDLPQMPGVYLAGDWVGPEGWLADAAFASGRAAARLALRQTGRRLNSDPVRQLAYA
ncbi:MAG TPA: FAD-dependent oxidoreductase [Candidatus Sulfomarinibacteraceae bacterium]|nr:FAD-dependent oxidoreductase [Candidatus Sulfomarinibacteraceae bacterium]